MSGVIVGHRPQEALRQLFANLPDGPKKAHLLDLCSHESVSTTDADFMMDEAKQLLFTVSHIISA